MKKMNSRELLNQLEVDIRQLILKVKYYSKEDASLLLVQVSSDKWSVAQILEHLNSYGRYYLPHMTIAIDKAEASHWSATTDYRSGDPRCARR